MVGRKSNEILPMGLKVVDWVGFRWVIGKVGGAGGPLNLEITVLDSVLYPMVPHGDGFGAFYFGCAIGESAGRTVVVGDER